MANEITISCSLAVSKNNYVDVLGLASTTFDQANEGGAGRMQNIGTSEETLDEGAVSTEGWLLMINLDSTNYVRWGFATGVYGGRMEPGEPALFRVNPSSTIYLIANTAACDVHYMLLED